MDSNQVSGNVALAVSGGIAAFKAAALTSRLAQRGVAVQTIMTAAAEQFLGAATLAALSGRPVSTQSIDPHWPLGPHIEIARWADLLIVAPATANFMAKAAHGVADDLLTTLYLACQCPVLVAPAMNSEMWSHPATQRNAEQLRADGVQLVGPDEGWLSCRVQGAGRMAEPETILEAALAHLSSTDGRKE